MNSITLISRSCCLISSVVDNNLAVHSPLNDVEYTGHSAISIFSNVSDWEEFHCQTKDQHSKILPLFEEEQFVHDVRTLIKGVSDSLCECLIGECESFLAKIRNKETVFSLSLIAPLVNPLKLDEIATVSAETGCFVFVDFIEEIKTLQPNIRRLSSNYLKHAPFYFSTDEWQLLWRKLAEGGQLYRLLLATKSADFLKIWNESVFCFANPELRKRTFCVGNSLASFLYTSNQVQHEYQDDNVMDEIEIEEDPQSTAHEEFERAQREIDGIYAKIKNGDDTSVYKWVDQLIARQLSASKHPEFATKSLCNLASKCRDIFRSDLEKFFLEKALSLNCNDNWANIQYGNFHKERLNFDRAKKHIQKALGSELDQIAKSSLADICTSEGLFEEAKSQYQQINNWETSPEIRIALADILRKSGDFDNAQNEYELLLSNKESVFIEGEEYFRCLAGIAEIKKNKGLLSEAETEYNGLLTQLGNNEVSSAVYKTALANVLQLSGKYDQAYSITKSLLETYPFWNQLIWAKASILALITNQFEQYFPELEENSYWYISFYNGLKLLHSKQFNDATVKLQKKAQNIAPHTREGVLIRLAATVAALHCGDTKLAKSLMPEENLKGDLNITKAQLLAKLHFALIEKNQSSIQLYCEEIEKHSSLGSNLVSFLEEIKNGNSTNLLRTEIESLLLAA